MMQINGTGKILRIYIGETDKWNKKPLYHELIKVFKKK
jgi:hypothetical protein